MSLSVALVDYGAGNLTSVRKALRAVGAEVFTPATPDDLGRADALVVPGVGHFAATAALDGGWRDAIARAAGAARPLLGICLGMQWLFDGSSEAPDIPGLGLLPGRCSRLGGDDTSEAAGRGQELLKVPHVGWNQVDPLGPSRLLAGIGFGAQAYFTHSFAAPITPATVATTVHGRTFASVVEHGPLFGVQFHPEKSGSVGLAVLRNFLRAVTGR